jgi:ATP diphosphatase
MSKPVPYSLDDLIYLMDRLRHPEDGCPWDRKQDFASIVPHTIEELYEVIDAIDKKDWPHVSEELGDLLFQIIFYAQLGKEKALFDFDKVVDGIVSKLVRRHPHVFPDGTLSSRLAPGQSISEEEITANWQRIKQLERASKPAQLKSDDEAPGSILDVVPGALPALQKAEKLQKIAASVGFDWPSIAPVIAKIREELDELEVELNAATQDQSRLQDELGDILFCCLNLARFIGVSGESALRGANQKFVRRFGYIEKSLRAKGVVIESTDLDTMDALWDEAKKLGL